MGGLQVIFGTSEMMRSERGSLNYVQTEGEGAFSKEIYLDTLSSSADTVNGCHAGVPTPSHGDEASQGWVVPIFEESFVKRKLIL